MRKTNGISTYQIALADFSFHLKEKLSKQICIHLSQNIGIGLNEVSKNHVKWIESLQSSDGCENTKGYE